MSEDRVDPRRAQLLAQVGTVISAFGSKPSSVALEVNVVLVGEAPEVVALSRGKRQQKTLLTCLWPTWSPCSLVARCPQAPLSLHLCVEGSQGAASAYMGCFEEGKTAIRSELL